MLTRTVHVCRTRGSARREDLGAGKFVGGQIRGAEQCAFLEARIGEELFDEFDVVRFASCEAVAMASSAELRGAKPSRSIAVACNGLFDDRG